MGAGPAARQKRIMKQLTQDLALSTTQQAEVEPIVARAHLGVTVAGAAPAGCRSRCSIWGCRN